MLTTILLEDCRIERLTVALYPSTRTRTIALCGQVVEVCWYCGGQAVKGNPRWTITLLEDCCVIGALVEAVTKLALAGSLFTSVLARANTGKETVARTALARSGRYDTSEQVPAAYARPEVIYFSSQNYGPFESSL